MDFDKRLKRNINVIKGAVKRLKADGLNIEIQETETMFGTLVNHIYVTDYIGDRKILQKYLFTENYEK